MKKDKNTHNINSIIESSFSDICKKTSQLTNSTHNNLSHYSWAENSFDPWFSRIFNFNIPKSNIHETISEMREKITNGSQPNSLLMTESDFYSEVKECLESESFTNFYNQVGMALHLDQLELSQNKIHSNIKILNNTFELNKWIKVIKEIFGSDKNSFLYEKYLSDNDFTFFAYYLDDKIIGTALLYISNNVAGIHMVGTLHDYRKKGIGSEITKLAFDFARQQGATIGVLQASPMGKTVYEKIGFKEYSKIAHWMYNVE